MATAADLVGSLPLFAGGKSFGARMTSQARAVEPRFRVRGLVCFGFPLHPAGKSSIDRARHLDGVRILIRLLQGTRDKLAEVAMTGASRPGSERGRRCLSRRKPITPSRFRPEAARRTHR